MLAERITYIRKIRKITEKELAAGIGMSMTGFRQAMANDDFKISTLYNIADFFKVNVVYFFQQSVNYNADITKAAEPYAPKIHCSSCEMKDEIIKQKEHTIKDLKYTIENLKNLIEQKDAIINAKRYD